jgi:hypothetical protein
VRETSEQRVLGQSALGWRNDLVQDDNRRNQSVTARGNDDDERSHEKSERCEIVQKNSSMLGVNKFDERSAHWRAAHTTYIPFTPAMMIGIKFLYTRSGELIPEIMMPTPAFDVPYAAPMSKRESKTYVKGFDKRVSQANVLDRSISRTLANTVIVGDEAFATKGGQVPAVGSLDL